MQPEYGVPPVAPAHEGRGHPNTGGVLVTRESRRETFELLHTDDLDISLLGSFQVRVGGRVIVESDWPLRRARNLIKLLALAPGHQIHRERLVDILWPEQTQEAATNNLHKALHVARHVLEPNLPGKATSRYIRLQGELVVLHAPGQVRVDVETFRALADAAYESDTPEAYLRALSLSVNELLPQDPYEDWAILHRERIKHLRLELLLRLARVYEERNEIDSAIPILQQIVEADPAHEEAHGRLILLFTRSGARQMALRQYRQLEAALKQELDAAPAPAIQKLYQDVLENRLPAQNLDPAPVPLNAGRTVVTASHPPVIGREKEVSAMAAHLRAAAGGTGNLVIIDGEAGSGKSHLMKKIAGFAVDQGFITLMGRAPTSAAPSPYGHISSALADCARRSRAPYPLTLEASNLALMLTLTSGTHLPAPRGSSVDPSRQALASSLVEDFFKKLCLHAPVLLMLDDLQTADEATLQLVEALASQVERMPLLVVGALRRLEVNRVHPQFDLLESLDQHAGATLTLRPLLFAETVELVSQLLDGPVERSVLEVIHSVAGGLPHFIYETVCALMGREGLQLVEGRWILHAGHAFGLARPNLRQPRLERTGS